VVTPVTFLDDGDQGVNMPGVIRTRGDTVFASDASVFIDDHNSVVLFPGGLDGTVDHTRGVVAIITEGGEKMPADVRVLTFLDDLDPGAEYP
jgi:hypothetical protein